jgi:transposase
MSGKKQYKEEFKKQIVMLYKNGKTRSELLREYEISSTTLYKWINNYDGTGSFKAKDNRTEEENELIELRKINKRLLMENDILKQAELLMARK